MTIKQLTLEEDGGMNKLRNAVQDCNLNFLLGSGISMPYLATLNNIEILLTAIEAENVSLDVAQVVRASLYKKYFTSVIGKNLDLLNDSEAGRSVSSDYSALINALNLLLHYRKSTVLGKQVNLFTTNIDIFLEKALEKERVEFNDGFSGIYNPVFDLSNFKKSCFKRSLQYDNLSEIPVFNLLKLHGSTTWELLEGAKIGFSNDLHHLEEVSNILPEDEHLVQVDADSTIESLIASTEGMTLDESVIDFMTEYCKLSIVNPTKEKFQDTLLNQTYYELLRIYANELEKENTVLFVMGFSFEDEHIREITLRAANSNPTLVIYIIAHTNKSGTEYIGKLGDENVKNNNIVVITPPIAEQIPTTDEGNVGVEGDAEVLDPLPLEDDQVAPELLGEPIADTQTATLPEPIDDFAYTLRETTERIFERLLPEQPKRRDN